MCVPVSVYMFACVCERVCISTEESFQKNKMLTVRSHAHMFTTVLNAHMQHAAGPRLDTFFLPCSVVSFFFRSLIKLCSLLLSFVLLSFSVSSLSVS